jgi:hypothetical protein
VGNNPIIFIDPYGLWEFSFDIYTGTGGGFTIGQDPQGNWYGSARGGVGTGISGSLNLGDTCPPFPKRHGGPNYGFGGYGMLGAQAGPIGSTYMPRAGLGSNLMPYYDPGEPILLPGIPLKLGIVVAAGVEAWVYTGK